jgi:hypothetical protein
MVYNVRKGPGLPMHADAFEIVVTNSTNDNLGRWLFSSLRVS